MRAAEWPSLKHQPPMPLFFLAPEYQSTVRHTKPQQDETTTHMNSKLPNAQETTCRQLCLVTVSKGKKGQRRQQDQQSGTRRRTPWTTYGFTSSGSDSSPGSSANWTLTTATGGVRPSSKYSNNHTGIASSNTVTSPVVPALATVPRYTMLHPGARSSATSSGMSCVRERVGPSAVVGGLSMPLERTT